MNNHPPRNGIMGVSGYTAFPEIGRPQPARPALTLERSLRLRRKRKVDFTDFMFPPQQQMIADDLIDFSQIRPSGDALGGRWSHRHENPCRAIVPRRVPISYAEKRDRLAAAYGDLAAMEAMARRHLAKYYADHDIDLATATFNKDRVLNFRLPEDDGYHTEALRKLSYAQKEIAAHAAANVRDAGGGGGDQEKNR